MSLRHVLSVLSGCTSVSVPLALLLAHDGRLSAVSCAHLPKLLPPRCLAAFVWRPPAGGFGAADVLLVRAPYN